MSHNDDTIVIDDPETPMLPFGCIGAKALRTLAIALEKLEVWHAATQYTPCLRRIESSEGCIRAHVSVGPAIGGSWEVLELKASGWVLK